MIMGYFNSEENHNYILVVNCSYIDKDIAK